MGRDSPSLSRKMLLLWRGNFVTVRKQTAKKEVSHIFTADMPGRFDLLETQGLGGLSDGLGLLDSDEKPEKLLIWQKLDILTFQPPARHGHSGVTIGYGSVIFGGLEAGTRVNSSYYFDAANTSWSFLPCKGDIPSPRCFHAACGFNGMMVVHGGEGPVVAPEVKELHIEENSSISNGANLNPGTQRPKYRSGPALDGICPGDNIQPSRFGSVAPQSFLTKASTLKDSNSHNVMSLDDMYALDCTSLTWVKLPLTLGPLPRRGHTLNTCHIYGKPSLLLLGGYSTETMVVSNSVLICEMEHVQNYVKNYLKRSKLLQSSIQAVKEERLSANLNQSDLPLLPIVWRSVQCKGTAPVGRYRHTSTVLSTDMDELLIVIGGIGRDPSTSLSDVHILHLGSLTWIELKSHKTVIPTNSLASSPQGPFLGVYGHTAFPILKPARDDSEDKHDLLGSESFNIIVFGGSSNPLDPQASAYHHLYSFDLKEHDWNKVLMGPQFPSSRAFQSSNFIANWSPFHTIPSNQVGGKDKVQTVPPSHANPKHRNQGNNQTRNNGVGQNIIQFQRTNSTATGLIHSESATFPLASDDDGEDNYLDFSVLDQTQHMNKNTVGSIMTFGGLGIASALNDVWVLDLQWRTAGLDQYDDNMEIKVKEQLQTYNSNTELKQAAVEHLTHVPFSTSNLLHTSDMSKIMSSNNAKYLQSPGMKVSASEPTLANTGQSDWTLSKTNKMKLLEHLQNNANRDSRSVRNEYDDDDDGANNKMVFKLRKERALADIQVKDEHNRLLESIRTINDMSKELEEVKQDYDQQLDAKEQEIKKLKELLHESLEREKKLMALNSEAYSLIKLHSIQSLQQS